MEKLLPAERGSMGPLPRPRQVDPKTAAHVSAQPVEEFPDHRPRASVSGRRPGIRCRSGPSSGSLVANRCAPRPQRRLPDAVLRLSWRAAPRRTMTSTFRTAGYGPVRPVVWEGRTAPSGAAPLSRFDKPAPDGALTPRPKEAFFVTIATAR